MGFWSGLGNVLKGGGLGFLTGGPVGAAVGAAASGLGAISQGQAQNRGETFGGQLDGTATGRQSHSAGAAAATQCRSGSAGFGLVREDCWVCLACPELSGQATAGTCEQLAG